MALTRNQVFAVCDQLVADGVKPTNHLIRDRLGEGSFTTINKYLREWKGESEAIPTPHDEPPAPPEDQGLIQRAYYRLETQLQQLQGELQGLQYAYQQQLDRFETVVRENESLRLSVKDYTEQLEQLHQELDQLKHSNQRLEEEQRTMPINDSYLNQASLARRLGIHPGTLTKNRVKPDFAEWSKGKDPYGMAWQYLPNVERYVPAGATTNGSDATTSSVQLY